MWLQKNQWRVNGIVAVAIDTDKGSQNALKFATDLVTKDSTIVLIHVNVKTSSSISTPSEQCLVVSKEIDDHTKQIFNPYHIICAQKNIHCKDIVLENEDVTKALIEYISQSAVEHLVIGYPNRNGFNKFKVADIPGTILKGAPDFCTVYVASKGKNQSMRSASRAAPAFSSVRSDPPDPSANEREEPNHQSSDATSSRASKDDVMALLLKMQKDQRDYLRFANEAHDWHKRVYNFHFKGGIVDSPPIFPAHILGDMEGVQHATHETLAKVPTPSKNKSKIEENDKKVGEVMSLNFCMSMRNY